MRNFRLYHPPKLRLNFRDSVTAFRFLFIVPIVLILALSISFNRVNRHLTFYAAQVDNSQNVRSSLADLSTLLHEINFNILAYNTYKNKSNRELALNNATDLLPLLSRLDSLVANTPDQAQMANRIREAIARLYGFDVSKGLTHFSDERKLPLPNTADMRTVYSEIAAMTAKADALMGQRLENRNSYQSKLFSYNWLLMIASIAFMALIFFVLDGKLRQNRTYRADLENKIENLNRSNSELEQFAYSASHDLQEPLRKIRSFSDRLMKKHAHEFGPEASALLDRINSSAGRMQQLIHDLLAFSQLMRKQSEKQAVELNKVLREVRSNLSLIIDEKNAVITADDLPTVNAYPSQMIQLFQNLIGNALKYSKPDLPPAVGISYAIVKGEEIGPCMPAHRLLDFHCLTITDNGIGFAEEFSDKVFSLFQRLHGRDAYDGTGIGLAICKRVVTNHDGYITAKSIQGLGASFAIYLPVDGSFSPDYSQTRDPDLDGTALRNPGR